jgi:hypothetical protein
MKIANQAVVTIGFRDRRRATLRAHFEELVELFELDDAEVGWIAWGNIDQPRAISSS